MLFTTNQVNHMKYLTSLIISLCLVTLSVTTAVAEPTEADPTGTVPDISVAQDAWANCMLKITYIAVSRYIAQDETTLSPAQMGNVLGQIQSQNCGPLPELPGA
jgi:hypothetical protein